MRHVAEVGSGGVEDDSQGARLCEVPDGAFFDETGLGEHVVNDGLGIGLGGCEHIRVVKVTSWSGEARKSGCSATKVSSAVAVSRWLGVGKGTSVAGRGRRG